MAYTKVIEHKPNHTPSLYENVDKPISTPHFREKNILQVPRKLDEGGVQIGSMRAVLLKGNPLRKKMSPKLV